MILMRTDLPNQSSARVCEMLLHHNRLCSYMQHFRRYLHELDPRIRSTRQKSDLEEEEDVKVIQLGTDQEISFDW